MKTPTKNEIANNYKLWMDYVDPSGLDTEEKFNSMSESEKLDMIEKCFGSERYDSLSDALEKNPELGEVAETKTPEISFQITENKGGVISGKWGFTGLSDDADEQEISSYISEKIGGIEKIELFRTNGKTFDQCPGEGVFVATRA